MIEGKEKIMKLMSESDDLDSEFYAEKNEEAAIVLYKTYMKENLDFNECLFAFEMFENKDYVRAMRKKSDEFSELRSRGEEPSDAAWKEWLLIKQNAEQLMAKDLESLAKEIHGQERLDDDVYENERKLAEDYDKLNEKAAEVIYKAHTGAELTEDDYLEIFFMFKERDYIKSRCTRLTELSERLLNAPTLGKKMAVLDDWDAFINVIKTQGVQDLRTLADEIYAEGE